MRTIRLIVVDTEVFAYDNFAVFKEVATGVKTQFHNDNEGILEYLQEQSEQGGNPIYVGANIKHYDQFILKAMANDFAPQEIKALNDFIILGGNNGWEYPPLRDAYLNINICDLFDDMQIGLSVKAIEAHLGMNIEETEVDFNIDRPLTPEEIEQTFFYCGYDVDAEIEYLKLRKGYLENKLTLGKAKGISPEKALYMTNAKLTAAYLDAVPKVHNDEREYKYPSNLLRQYIPQFVFDFFDRMHDPTIPDEELFSSKLEFKIGECQVTIAYGGIHGAIPCYREKATNERSIRNRDVASYYPHLMTIDGYCSRSIPNPDNYAIMLENRMRAKKAGDKATANALKLVANTTYGAMLNQYNDLYDPLMGRSVCVTGQLRLLELTNHLVSECPSIVIVQLNTDGIMVSIDNADIATYNEICQEWQDRTGFELEEDCIAEIVQKDVNNYCEIATDGSTKIKGGQLVRGIAPAGAFNINNNATIIATALVEYFSKDIPVKETINACVDPMCFQLIAKASSKYSTVFHLIGVDERVETQKVNRVYSSKDRNLGTLVKVHAETGHEAKIAGLPPHCYIDNRNEITIDEIDKSWYIRQAERYVNDFLGNKPQKRKNTRQINKLKKEILSILED